MNDEFNDGFFNDGFIDNATILRKEIKALAAKVWAFKNAVLLIQAPSEAKEEVVANTTLAYRHLEDASMRLGKAIQATDGGVSVYDRESTVGA